MLMLFLISSMQCHIRGQAGTLFLGKSGIIFLPKLSLFIRKDSISSFVIDDGENQRSARYLNLIVVCGSQKTEFGMIERQNKPLLLNYFEFLSKLGGLEKNNENDGEELSEEDSDYLPANSEDGSNTESGSESGESSDSDGESDSRSESSSVVELLDESAENDSDVDVAKENEINRLPDDQDAKLSKVKKESHGSKQQADIMRFVVRKEE